MTEVRILQGEELCKVIQKKLRLTHPTHPISLAENPVEAVKKYAKPEILRLFFEAEITPDEGMTEINDV